MVEEAQRAEQYHNSIREDTTDRGNSSIIPKFQSQVEAEDGSGNINNLRPLTQQTKPKFRGKKRTE